MFNFNITFKMSRLILFQRNEIMTNFQKKIRKLFGRYLYTQLFSYINNRKHISKEYFNVSNKEYIFLKKFIRPQDKNILSIGGGLGGVECIILSNHSNVFMDMIERDFISKKIRYFFNPDEAYNKLNLTKEFILMNSLNAKNFLLFDYENKHTIKKKYDLIFSLFSMDYHYDLINYYEFFKNNSHKETNFIFDTVRYKELKKFFKKVEVLENVKKEIHSHSRVICSELIS